MTEKVDIEDLIEEKFRSPEIERKVIAYAIRRDYRICSFLKRDVFTVEIYRYFYDVIDEKRTTMAREILESYVQKIIPKDKKDDVSDYIEKIFLEKLRGVTDENIRLFVDQMIEMYESRSLLAGVGKVIENIDAFNLENAKKILKQSISPRGIESQIKSGNYLDDFEDRLEKIKEHQNNKDKFVGVATGIPEFDRASGGIMPGEMVVVLGQTSVGKTMFLGNVGCNAWFAGKNVIYFSLEMSKEDMQFRIDSRMVRLEHKKFRKAALGDEDIAAWGKKINELRGKFQNYYEICRVPRDANVDLLEEQADRIQNKHGSKADVVVVDYLNLLIPNNERLAKYSKKGWESQSEVVWDLKSFSNDFNRTGVPVLTANQVTDEFNPNKMKLETKHAKYARSISETAPIILGLSQSDQEYLNGELRLSIIKCRDFGKVEPILLRPNFAFMLMDAALI